MFLGVRMMCDSWLGCVMCDAMPRLATSATATVCT